MYVSEIIETNFSNTGKATEKSKLPPVFEPGISWMQGRYATESKLQ